MTNSKQAISKITNANFLPKSTKEALLKLIIILNEEETKQLINFLNNGEKKIKLIEESAIKQKSNALKAVKEHLKEIRRNQKRHVLKLAESSVNKFENADKILLEL